VCDAIPCAFGLLYCECNRDGAANVLRGQFAVRPLSLACCLPTNRPLRDVIQPIESGKLVFMTGQPLVARLEQPPVEFVLRACRSSVSRHDRRQTGFRSLGRSCFVQSIKSTPCRVATKRRSAGLFRCLPSCKLPAGRVTRFAGRRRVAFARAVAVRAESR